MGVVICKEYETCKKVVTKWWTNAFIYL